VVAVSHGRRFLGIELNPEYAEMARARLRGEVERCGLATADDHGADGAPMQLGLRMEEQ
jgi:DNA modification methylase